MKLHKLLLMQLPYFEALFGPHWNEANKETIQIIINDDNITERCKFIEQIYLIILVHFAILLQLSNSSLRVYTLASWITKQPKKTSFPSWQQVECST